MVSSLMISENTHNNDFNGIYRDILINVFLVTLILFVYLQVKDYEFINFDDNKYIYENRHVQRGLTPESILWAFTSTYAANWHPMTWLSHMLDVTLFGMNAGMHHLMNVLFHLFNSMLLYFIFQRMTGDRIKSFIVALLFSLHPLHVESVAWVAERKDVLSTFFWMVTMWYYVIYSERPGVKRYFLVLLFFIFGLMSKPMLVTLPFVLVLLDYWPLRRFSNSIGELKTESSRPKTRIKDLVLEKIPFFILTVGLSVVTFLVQKKGGAVVAMEFHSFDQRVANALVSYIGYIWKMLWPFKLSVLYPYPSSLPPLKTIGAGFLIIIITIVAIKLRKQNPYIIIGWLWFIGTLVPVIGLIQVGSQAMADRYTYVPLIGLFVIISWGMLDIFAKFRINQVTQGAIVTAILSFLLVLTWIQVQYWTNSITLFKHTVMVTSDNHEAYTNLGAAFQKLGRKSDAIKHYFEALWINPNDMKAHLNLGNELASQGRVDEAFDHYFEALCIKPDYALAHQNLGIAFTAQGKLDEAVEQYNKALFLNPDLLSAHVSLGYILERQGKIYDAIWSYFEALHIDPDLAVVHFNLGVALVKQRKFAEAVYHYSESLRLNPDDAEAHNNLGTALIRLGKIEKALDHFQEALRIKPDYVIAQNNLENTLEAQRKFLNQDVSNIGKKK